MRRIDGDTPGTLYLLHFTGTLGDATRPRMSARHYLGWADDLDARLEEHRAAQGAKITAAAVRAGYELLLVWHAPGTHNDEHRMKRAGNHAKRCVVCKAEAVIEAAGQRGTLFDLAEIPGNPLDKARRRRDG